MIRTVRESTAGMRIAVHEFEFPEQGLVIGFRGRIFFPAEDLPLPCLERLKRMVIVDWLESIITKPKTEGFLFRQRAMRRPQLRWPDSCAALKPDKRTIPE